MTENTNRVDEAHRKELLRFLQRSASRRSTSTRRMRRHSTPNCLSSAPRPGASAICRTTGRRSSTRSRRTSRARRSQSSGSATRRASPIPSASRPRRSRTPRRTRARRLWATSSSWTTRTRPTRWTARLPRGSRRSRPRSEESSISASVFLLPEAVGCRLSAASVFVRSRWPHRPRDRGNQMRACP